MLKSLFSRGIWSAYECHKCKSKIFNQVATVPTVKRTYFVQLPDGRRQKVGNKVDDDSGFVANVSFE
jgi:hypothetical protein